MFLDKTNKEFELNQNIKTIEIGNIQRNELIVIDLSDRSTKEWEDLTRKNIGNKLVFLLDNTIIMTPIVHNAITGGALTISSGSQDEKKNVENVQPIEKW